MLGPEQPGLVGGVATMGGGDTEGAAEAGSLRAAENQGLRPETPAPQRGSESFQHQKSWMQMALAW